MRVSHFYQSHERRRGELSGWLCCNLQSEQPSGRSDRHTRSPQGPSGPSQSAPRQGFSSSESVWAFWPPALRRPWSSYFSEARITQTWRCRGEPPDGSSCWKYCICWRPRSSHIYDKYTETHQLGLWRNDSKQCFSWLWFVLVLNYSLCEKSLDSVFHQTLR